MDKYGQLPEQLGKYKIKDQFGVYILYCPIKMKGANQIQVPITTDVNLSLMLIDIIQSQRDILNKYVYLSFETNYIEKNSTQKRPGWHCDGFLTNDINYIWYSNTPTIFNTTEFKITEEHNVSMEQFEQQVNSNNNVIFPNETLIKLDSHCVHRATPMQESCVRTFIKISISDDKYNLQGNTHNPEFNYNWTMYDREKVRNHPQIKEVDSVSDEIGKKL